MVVKKYKFALSPHELLTNPTISLTAKGLYAFLQIFDTDGDIDFSYLCKAYKIDKQEFDKAFDELIFHGFISIETESDILVYVLNGI